MIDDTDHDTPDQYRPDPAADTLHEAYRAKLAAIATLPELDMRVASIDQALRHRPAREAAWWIDQLLRGALWGKSAAVDAFMAGARWLIEQRIDDDYQLIKDIFEAAHGDDRRAVVAILRDPPAHQQLPEGRRLPEVDLPQDRDMTLGERRTMARSSPRDVLDRLLLDPSPLVIAQLLDNPKLRQKDVLQVASRRPNLPDIMVEIALHPRWYLRRELRFAVVMNPYTGTGLSLKLLATLGIHKLRQVAHATHLHPTLVKTARTLVELREEHTAPWRV